jgi:hypothetical protein
VKRSPHEGEAPIQSDKFAYDVGRDRGARQYRAQTKGKIESGVMYFRRNFVRGLLGREPSCLMGFNTELRQWVDGRRQPAGARDHARTGAGAMGHGSVQHAFVERPFAHLYSGDELREVARDAYVSWRASLLGAAAVCGQRSLGARTGSRRGVALRRTAHRSACSRRAPPPDHASSASPGH